MLPASGRGKAVYGRPFNESLYGPRVMIEADESPEFDMERQIVASAGTFALLLVPKRKRFFDQRKSIPAHESVLRPLCKWATEGWVYELDAESEAYHAANGILKRDRGKYRIDLWSQFGGDSIGSVNREGQHAHCVLLSQKQWNRVGRHLFAAGTCAQSV